MPTHTQKEKSGITIPPKQKQRTTTQINTNMTISEYRAIIKKNKYHASKVEMDGVVYDSKKEAKRAGVLQQQEKYGIITNLQRQVTFELQPGYINNQGKKIRPITYIADFTYEQEGKKIVEDCKGFRTKEYSIKKKIFEFKYPEYTFVES